DEHGFRPEGRCETTPRAFPMREAALHEVLRVGEASVDDRGPQEDGGRHEAVLSAPETLCELVELGGGRHRPMSLRAYQMRIPARVEDREELPRTACRRT